MKYFIRAVKYYITLMAILVLLIGALVAFKVVDGNLETLFVNGYDSYWQIALMLAVFSAVYPRLGYAKRNVRVPGEFQETYPGVEEVMRSHGYRLEKREGENMTFVKASPLSRALKMWEDRISFTRTLAGFEIEGLTRDLPRLIAALETKFIP